MTITHRNKSSSGFSIFNVVKGPKTKTSENCWSGNGPPRHTVGELQVIKSGSGLSFNIWTVIHDPEEADRPNYSGLRTSPKEQGSIKCWGKRIRNNDTTNTWNEPVS